MASTFTLKSSAYQGRYLQLSCTQTKDIATNKSKINWTLSSVGGSSNYYSTGATTVYINGVQVYYKARIAWDEKIFPAAKGSVSGVTYVDHDTKGKKTISVSLTTAIYVGSSSATTNSDTWTLDDIPRQATITSAPDFTDLGNPTITYSNPAGNAVDSLMACISLTGAKDDIPYRAISKTGDSYTFSLTEAERNTLRNATTTGKRDVSFFVRTIIGGTTFYSTSTKKLNIEETDNTKPSISMTIELNNGSLPSTFNGMYIQNKSRLKINLSASTKYNASISSFSAFAHLQGFSSMIAGTTTTHAVSYLTDVITKSGEVGVTGSVTDSREFTNSAAQKLNFLEYSKPLVVPVGSESAILCYRSDGNGKKVGGSTSVWVKAKRSYYSLTGKNTCAFEWRRRLAAETWSDSAHPWKTLVAKTTTTTNEYNALLTGGNEAVFEPNKSYAIQIRVKDDVGEYDIKEFEIPTQDVALHLGEGGKNVSVGTYCDRSVPYTFYSDWDAYFDKNIYVQGNKMGEFFIERGTKVINGVTWTYRKYLSGDVMCEAVVKMEGCTDITVFTGQDYSYKAITLPFEFDGMPNINLTGISTAGKDVYGTIAYSVRDYTSTGFNIQQTCKASVKEAWVSVLIIGKLK